MAGFGKGGAELQAKECRQPLEVEKPSKERGPQSCRRREPDSASDPVEQENGFSPAISQEDHRQPCGSLDFSLVTLSASPAGLPTCKNRRIVNVCDFEPCSL